MSRHVKKCSFEDKYTSEFCANHTGECENFENMSGTDPVPHIGLLSTIAPEM